VGDGRGRRGQLVRADWAPAVQAGMVACHICGQLIHPGQLWDIDHLVPLAVDPSLNWEPGNQRPAHRRCNRSRGAKQGNRRRAVFRGQQTPRHSPFLSPPRPDPGNRPENVAENRKISCDDAETRSIFLKGAE